MVIEIYEKCYGELFVLFDELVEGEILIVIFGDWFNKN